MFACAYCGARQDADVDDQPPVPDVDDDASWEELAAAHAEDCEWVLTRAHRVELSSE